MKNRITILLITFLCFTVQAQLEMRWSNASVNNQSSNLESKIDTLIINTSSEGYTIEITILKNKMAMGKLPSVLFIVGSGEFSTLTTYKDMTEFYFDNNLLDAGFAMVYFDKRGLGNSEGIWYETTFEQRALDAKNVALEVQKLDFIDKNKQFVIGHSQGGWITKIVLANYPEVFAGGISMAGPTYGVKKQIVNDYHSKIMCDKKLDEKKALKKATRKVNRDLFLITAIGRKGNFKQLKIIKNFETKEYLKVIQKPILLMYAKNDRLVYPEWCLESLNAIFPEKIPDHIEFYTAQGQNHSFKVAPKCYKGKWKEIAYSETSKNKIKDWLITNLENDTGKY